MKYLLTIVFALGIALTPSVAFAATESPGPTKLCASGDNSATGQALQSVGMTGDDCKGDGVTNTASRVVSLLSWLIGIVAIIMIIVAGFKYITSGGDANNISSAKRTLIYAIVGLVIVVLAQFITHFVIKHTNSALSVETDMSSRVGNHLV